MRSLAYRLAIVFVFTVPWEAAVKLPQIGRGSKVLGLLVGAVWITSVIARGRVRPPAGFQKLVFLFVVWSGLTVLWSEDSSATVSGFLTYLQLFGVVLMFWDLFDSKGAIETAVQAYVLGAFITAVSIIANYATAPAAKFPAHERINALGSNADGIALIVAIAGPAAWYLALQPASSRVRLALRMLNYAYLPVGMFALVLTGTRGAAVASIPTVVFVLWSLGRMSNTTRVAALVTIVAAVVLVAAFAPRGPLSRIQSAATATRLGGEGGALSGRWAIWTDSVQAFLEHPVAGVGLDAHRAAVAPAIGERTIYKKAAKVAHNSYLSVLTETGIVGFVLFGGMIATIVLSVRRLSGLDAWYWSSQLLVLAIGALSLSIEESKSVWIFTSLAVAAAATATLPAIAGRERAPATGTATLRTVGGLHAQR